MVGVMCGISCAPPDSDTGLELSAGTLTGATTTVVVVTEITFLRGEALAEAAMRAAVAMGETSVLFRLREDADESDEDDADVEARVLRLAAGAVLGVGAVVAALATVFLAVLTGLSVPTVLGVTLFFIAILYKTEFTNLWWVNEMGIKTVQSLRGHNPDTVHSATIKTTHRNRAHRRACRRAHATKFAGGKFALYRNLER